MGSLLVGIQRELRRIESCTVQILVFLRRHKGEEFEYLLLKRADMGVWQGVAGGGEGDETPIVAAIRETREETGVEISDIVDLRSVAELSVIDVAGCYRWGEDIRIIPEFAFLADVPSDAKIKISCEHTEYLWCNSEPGYAAAGVGF